MLRSHPVLLMISCIGFGDVLYHTPLIRRLRRDFAAVHVWCKNEEPLLNNPDISKLFRVRKAKLLSPVHFYFRNIITVPFLGPLKHESVHTVDYVTLNALGLQLPVKERYLEFQAGETARKEVHRILSEHSLAPYGFVIITPASGWLSRTLPSAFYEELVNLLQQRGKKVVVLGRDINPVQIGADSAQLVRSEQKGLVRGPWMSKCIDLSNRLSLHQAAALFELADYAVLGETGLMPLAGTTHCPFVYLPQLVPPEMRLPWRRGILGYGVEVVERREPYESQQYWRAGFLLHQLAPWVPAIADVASACERLEHWIQKEGRAWIMSDN